MCCMKSVRNHKYRKAICDTVDLELKVSYRTGEWNDRRNAIICKLCLDFSENVTSVYLEITTMKVFEK